MTRTFCTDDVRVKVPSFQKVAQFLQYKTFLRDIIRLNVCLFEDIPDCRDLRRISLKSFASIGIFVSFIQNLHCSVRFIFCDTALKFLAIIQYH